MKFEIPGYIPPKKTELNYSEIQNPIGLKVFSKKVKDIEYDKKTSIENQKEKTENKLYNLSLEVSDFPNYYKKLDKIITEENGKEKNEIGFNKIENKISELLSDLNISSRVQVLKSYLLSREDKLEIIIKTNSKNFIGESGNKSDKLLNDIRKSYIDEKKEKIKTNLAIFYKLKGVEISYEQTEGLIETFITGGYKLNYISVINNFNKNNKIDLKLTPNDTIDIINVITSISIAKEATFIVKGQKLEEKIFLLSKDDPNRKKLIEERNKNYSNLKNTLIQKDNLVNKKIINTDYKKRNNKIINRPTKVDGKYNIETNLGVKLNGITEKEYTSLGIINDGGKTISNNPKALNNLIEFKKTLNELNLDFIWKNRSDFLLSAKNNLGATNDLNNLDSDSISKDELLTTLNFILKVLGKKSDNFTLDNAKKTIRDMNQANFNEEKMDIHGRTIIENMFIDRGYYKPHSSIMKIDTYALQDSNNWKNKEKLDNK